MKKHANFLFWLYVGFIGVAAFLFVIWATPYGPGVSPDSTTYIGIARSKLTGKSDPRIEKLETHYPPLYPLVLSATNVIGISIVQGARLLNATLFAINAGLIALALYLAVGRNYLIVTAAMLFFISTKPLIVMHLYAWSEPLFITFTLALLISLVLYAKKPRFFWLFASALFLGAALITRYIGAAILPPALLIIFIAGKGQPMGQRIRSTIAYAVLAGAPLGASLLRNMLATGGAVNRSFIFHPIPLSKFIQGLVNVTFDFFAPITLALEVKLVLFWLLVAALTALLVKYLLQHRREGNWRSEWLVMLVSGFLFVFSYLLFLLLSITFVDAATTVDTRLISPIFVVLIPGIFSTAWYWLQKGKKTVLFWSFSLIVLMCIAAKTPIAAKAVTNYHEKGIGYTSLVWRGSKTVAFVRSLENSEKIYTNGPDVISFFTENPTLFIPEKYSSVTTEENLRYNEEIKAMCSEVIERKAILVYFKNIGRGYIPKQAEIESSCRLPVLQQVEDGIVYGKSEN